MYSFANLCRFCKKSDKHFINITSKMFREFMKIYNILCKDTDVELNTCLQQVCQKCFQILISISDILSECNRTDIVFRKYLAILQTNDKYYATCECIMKDQVIHYGYINQYHNRIKKDLVMDLYVPSTSNEYNENIIKTEIFKAEITDEYNEQSNFDSNQVEDENTVGNIDELPNEDIKHLYLEHASHNTPLNEDNFIHESDQSYEEESQHQKFNNMTKLNTNLHNSTGKSSECDKSIHTNEHRFKYDLCNKKFSQKGDLNRHNLIHIGEYPFECDICKKKFTMKANLTKHKRIHTGERPFECDVCNKKFNTKGNLNVHKLIHTGERPFECHVCNKKFYQKIDLNRHNLIHTGECPFECDVCKKKFSLKCHFIEHIRVHTGERPFECDVCNKKYTGRGSLLVHKRIHTGENFECDVCYKKFNTIGNLNQHKRIHTDERPFECDICNKKFNTIGSLNVHKRIHTGERPFECDICSKKFNQKGALIRHRVTHIGECSFECDVCNKKFNTIINLRVHKHIHTDV